MRSAHRGDGPQGNEEMCVRSIVKYVAERVMDLCAARLGYTAYKHTIKCVCARARVCDRV